MTRLAIISLCLAMPGALWAAAEDGSFAVDGPGAQTCSFFVNALEEKDERASIAFAAWTEGFMTGVNVFREDTYDITPWQTPQLIMAKMRVFCAANPDMAYVNGLGRLVSVLLPMRQTEESAMVQARFDGKAVTLPAWVLEQVRAELEERTGAPLPTAAGDFDRAFAERLQAFQNNNNLGSTGLPDQDTLNALFP